MTTVKTTPFDPAEYLDTPDAVAAYLTDALETGDPAFVAAALGVIARARGMTEVAREAGVSRESLYRALSADGNPSSAPSCASPRRLACEFPSPWLHKKPLDTAGKIKLRHRRPRGHQPGSSHRPRAGSIRQRSLTIQALCRKAHTEPIRSKIDISLRYIVSRENRPKSLFMRNLGDSLAVALCFQHLSAERAA